MYSFDQSDSNFCLRFFVNQFLYQIFAQSQFNLNTTINPIQLQIHQINSPLPNMHQMFIQRQHHRSEIEMKFIGVNLK